MYYKTLGCTSTPISAIGQGTGIGGYSSRPGSYEKLADIIRLGIELGMTFIDTAPVYGNGQSEEAVGKAIHGVRDNVFVATKVSPENVSYEDVLKSAEASLRRLEADYIDLYQVHWSNPRVPMAETMRGISRLVEEGKVRYIGVGNFSPLQLREAQAVLPSKSIVSIQVEYNLFDRGIEDHILPHCEQEGITVIAYSPLHRGRIVSSSRHVKTLKAIAEKYNGTIAQVALRWLVAHTPVVAIPNTTNPERVKENAASADFDLLHEDIEEISRVCVLKPMPIPTESIRVSTECDRAVYQTLEEAIENRLNFVPSPLELAEQIRDGEFLKPVRLIRARGSNDEYDLVEGRVRYWAWVIAHKGRLPIPALVEESD